MVSSLYCYFLKDVIEKLNPKYQALVTSLETHYFIASNFTEIPTYYNILSVHKNRDYRLYQKFNSEEKAVKVVEFYQKQIIDNDYNETYLLFLYGYITHNIFKEAIDNYIDSLYMGFGLNKLTKKQKAFRHELIFKYLEADYLKTRENKDLKNINYNEEYLIYLPEELKPLVKSLFEEVFFFSLGDKFYDLSLEKFRKYQAYAKDKYGFKKAFLAVYDFFTFFKEKTSRILSNHLLLKKDYLNKTNKPWNLKADIECSLSFFELYDHLVDTAVSVLNKLTESIYYKKVIKGGIECLIDKAENLLEEKVKL